MPAPDDFAGWAIFHCTAFGLTTENAKSVALWREAYTAKKFTGDELRAATNKLLGETPGPKYLSDHRARLIALVEDARRKTEPEYDDRRYGERLTAAEWAPLRDRLILSGNLVVSPAEFAAVEKRSAKGPKSAPLSKPAPSPAAAVDYKARAAGERDGPDAGEEEVGGEVPF